jgi:hypothetical protein
LPVGKIADSELGEVQQRGDASVGCAYSERAEQVRRVADEVTGGSSRIAIVAPDLRA